MKWHENIHDIYIHNDDENTYPDDVKASNNLSPLTNFFINVFLETLNKKNIIVTIPDTILRPIPLISYIFAKITGKSVLVFTQKVNGKKDHNPINIHRENYHLLNYGKEFKRGDYLFYDVPMGTISKNKVHANTHIPLAHNKRRYRELQEKNFLESKKPKILLNSDERNVKITELIDVLVNKDNNNHLEFKSEFDLGLLVFENVDRFLGSKFELVTFLKWLESSSERNIKYIFHFSNPESKFIKILREKTDSLVIPWSPVLLNKEQIKTESIKYFNKFTEFPVHKKILGKVNIDSERFYYNKTKIEIIKPTLDSGNIDFHYKNANILLKKLNHSKLVNKILFSTILSFFYKMPDILINPSKYKYKYLGENGYRHYTLPQLLKIFQENMKKEDEETVWILNYILSEIFLAYSKLKERKRYNEIISYNLIGKDYFIRDIIKNNSNLLNIDENEVIIATYSSKERNILKKELSEMSFENTFKVEHIKYISKSTYDRSKTNLILPGPLRIKYFSELLKPYNKIYFLAYDGQNLDTIKQQINLVFNYSFEREKSFIDYLNEIYEIIGVRKNSILNEYYKDKKTASHDDNNHSHLDLIRNIIQTIPEFDLVKEHEDSLHHVEKTHSQFLTELEVKRNESEICLDISLKKIGSDELIQKKLPLYKTYYFLKEQNGEIYEDTPSNLKTGYFVVILDNDERKSLLELIIEIYDLEEDVDKHIVETWKWKLSRFVQEQELKPSELYKLYLENGGQRVSQTLNNWLKGSVIGPEHPQDLLIIGKMLNDEEIIENYELIEQEIRIVRKIHRNIGRKVKKIVKETLKGKLNLSTLNFEERKLYEKIKDGIYEVYEISDLSGEI